MSDVLRQAILSSGQVLQIVSGDLTGQPLDAIVNAANAQLQHGGGVAAAISRRGGPAIQAESAAWVRRHGPVPHHRPAYTTAGDLPCKYVIHAVGPVFGQGDEDEKLAAAVTGSLRVAEELGLASLAFPAISTGIFGFPKDRAAEVTLATLCAFFDIHPAGSLRLVRLVLIDPPTQAAFTQVWDACFPPARAVKLP